MRVAPGDSQVDVADGCHVLITVSLSVIASPTDMIRLNGTTLAAFDFLKLAHPVEAFLPLHCLRELEKPRTVRAKPNEGWPIFAVADDRCFISVHFAYLIVMSVLLPWKHRYGLSLQFVHHCEEFFAAVANLYVLQEKLACLACALGRHVVV